jgi:hypothetical protein
LRPCAARAKENMRNEIKELGFGFIVALLAAMLFGMLFWTVRIAQAWDTKVGRMVATIDLLMEKAYGIAVPPETR